VLSASRGWDRRSRPHRFLTADVQHVVSIRADTEVMTTVTRADGAALRVLAVDDEENLAQLLSMALRHEGFDVRTAGSGRTAVAAARDGRR